MVAWATTQPGGKCEQVPERGRLLLIGGRVFRFQTSALGLTRPQRGQVGPVAYMRYLSVQQKEPGLNLGPLGSVEVRQPFVSTLLDSCPRL